MGNDESQIEQKENHQVPNLPKPTSMQEFEVIEVLGEGAFATVYLAERKANKKKYALKIIHKSAIIQSAQKIRCIKEEIQILQTMSSPFLVQVISAFQNANDLIIVLEYVPGGDIAHHIFTYQRFSEQETKFLIAQIILALDELHKRETIMRDLKPENILVDFRGYIKLTDFGLSKHATQNESITANTVCGTLDYIAPEQLLGKPYGVEVDYWSLGVIAYQMIYGFTPFSDQDKNTQMQNILKADIKFDNKISENAKLFISQCCEKDPKKRLGYNNQIQQLKFHKWLSDIDWVKLYDKQYQTLFLHETAREFAEMKNKHGSSSNFNSLYDMSDVDDTDIEVFQEFEVDQNLNKSKFEKQKRRKAKRANHLRASDFDSEPVNSVNME